MIIQVDVLETGTEAELQALVASAKGKSLEGHPDLVCVAARRDDGLDTHGPGEPRKDANGQPVPSPRQFGKPEIDYPVIPGQLRVRLTYKPAAAGAPTVADGAPTEPPS
jgi:hypothetical protein